ncbi:hypothetical protein C0992_003680 [Termitomyces sp. T32_za158]|nr:hypothetical protein C0992_003680 [Termitomyces sp. T32_za158]
MEQANSVPSTFRTWRQTVRKDPGAAPLPGLPCDNDACSNNTLCYVDPLAPSQLEPASFHHKQPPYFDLCQTCGRDAPPPPESCHFNQGPPRTPLGPPATPLMPHPASPARPPRPPLGPLGPPPHRPNQRPPQPLQGPPRPLPGQLPAPPSDLGNPGGLPPPSDGTPAHSLVVQNPLAVQDPLVVQDPLAADPQEAGPSLWASSHLHKAATITTTTYYYYNAGPPPCNPRPLDDNHNALAQEGKLDIQRPELFTGQDPRRWRAFLTQCLNPFQAKLVTFQLDNACIAFAASYLQGIAFDHYTTLLWFKLQNPILSNWQAFIDKFLTKFRVFDTVAEAKDNLFNL